MKGTSLHIKNMWLKQLCNRKVGETGPWPLKRGEDSREVSSGLWIDYWLAAWWGDRHGWPINRGSTIFFLSIVRKWPSGKTKGNGNGKWWWRGRKLCPRRKSLHCDPLQISCTLRERQFYWRQTGHGSWTNQTRVVCTTCCHRDTFDRREGRRRSCSGWAAPRFNNYWYRW